MHGRHLSERANYFLWGGYCIRRYSVRGIFWSNDAGPNKQTPPGIARQLVTFLVLPRKVTKRSRPRFAAPAGFPRYFANKRGCATRPSRAHKTCPAAELEQCSPKPPLVCEISRRRTGERGRMRFCVRFAHGCLFVW